MPCSRRYRIGKDYSETHRLRHRGNIKVYIQTRINGWRGGDLTVDYLVGLYNAQQGRCFYSGLTMIFDAASGHGSPKASTMSLDKQDPARGYVQGNVVWCTYLVNTMKQNMPEREFYAFLESLLAYRDSRLLLTMERA